MAEKWIADAIKHPGSLHRDLGVPQGEKIPAKKLAKAAHSDKPRVRRKAALAKTLKGFHHAHQPRPKTNPGDYDNSAHPPPSRLQENPGEADMYTHPRIQMGQPHSFKPPATTEAHGYSHDSHQRDGFHRNSGHVGAHRIGKR